MRKLTVIILAVITTTLVARASAAPAAGVCDRLWVVDGELWLTQGEQCRLMTTDQHGIFSPRWSSAGDRIAYAHDFRFDGPIRSEIVIVNENGEVLHTLPISRESEVNAIMQIGWRDERHLFAEGHVNPSTTKYLEWDLDLGRLVDEKTGSWFAVSPNGRFVAQRAHVPHGAPPPYDSSMLLINDSVVYPREGESGYHSFAAGLAWSADSSRVVLLDRTGGETEIVVVNAVDGGISRAPIAATFAPTELSWSGPNTITARGDGEEWRVDAVTGKAQSVKDLPDSSKSLAVPSMLRERLHGLEARLVDTRCRQ